jgi:hypothetical protein
MEETISSIGVWLLQCNIAGPESVACDAQPARRLQGRGTDRRKSR